MAGINGIINSYAVQGMYSVFNPKKTDPKKAEEKTETTTRTSNIASDLIPKNDKKYGNTIGDAKLSEKAEKYYDKLKKKFHGNNFVLVSEDKKQDVQKNVSKYGNANGMVVLINEDKLEKMANDPSYARKYENIIKQSQQQMYQAKTDLAATGAKVSNFGMSVNSDGTTKFFATLEKSNKETQKLAEKKAENKKQQKAKDKKKAEKKEQEEKIYEDVEASSLRELMKKVQEFAFKSKENNETEDEKKLGKNIDYTV